MLDSLILGVHLLSAHSPDRDRYNNLNYGIYARTQESYEVGVFINTAKRPAFYFGYEHRFAQSWSNWSLTYGVTTGYDRRGRFTNDLVCEDGQSATTRLQCYVEEGYWDRGPIAPFITLGYRFPKQTNFTPRLDIAPMSRGVVIHLRFEWQ